MKCEICKAGIATTFLDKIKGTHVKDENGKKHIICFDCQKKFKDKAEILASLKQ